MAYFYRLIACALALVLFGAASFAAVPVAQQYSISEHSDGVGWHFSKSSACDAMVGYYRSKTSRAYTSSPLTSNELCYLAFNGDDAFHKFWYRESARCPANSVLNPGTNSCTCDTGFTEENGQCKYTSTGNSCNGLSDFCLGLRGQKISLEGNGSASPPGCAPDSARPNCAMGCAGEEVGIGVSYKDSNGDWKTGQEYRVTGGTCTLPQPSDVPQKKESDCAGSVGEVNGVRTCVPNQAATGDKKTTEKQNSDGSTTSTESKTTCENGVCTTTTTTTNKDASGNTTGSSTSSSTTSQLDYCAQNKTSSVCAATNGDKNPGKGSADGKGEGEGDGEEEGDKSQFGGSCAGGFTCEGDAISCSISKEIHTRNCQMDALKDSDLFRAWEGVKDFGTKNVTNDLPGNKRFDISVTDRDDFLSGGSCPPDRTIEIGAIGSITLPFSELCPWLQMLGYVNIVFASVAGGLIIIRRQS